MSMPFRKEETQIAENGLNSVQTKLGKCKYNNNEISLIAIRLAKI